MRAGKTSFHTRPRFTSSAEFHVVTPTKLIFGGWKSKFLEKAEPCGIPWYEIMRYWDEDLPDWDAEDRDFAVAWRSQPKWVVSRSLKSAGPNTTLVADDFEKVIRRLKAELAGEIQVGGPVLAQSLTEAGLIDEYRLYLRPVVLGGGTPFFAGPRPPLHLVASDLIADDFIRLTYVPA